MKKLVLAVMTVSALMMFSASAFAECSKDGKTCSKDNKTCSKDGKTCCKASAASKDPTAQDVVIDPVCGMDIKAEGCKNTYKYKGKEYRFCSEKCQKSFTKDPSKYIGKEPKK